MKNSSKNGLKKGWIRATFIVEEDMLEKLKDLAYTNRTKIKEEINEAIKKHIEGEKVIEREVNPIGKESGKDTFIYMLMDGEEVVYVGQTVNLKDRINDHKYSGKVFEKYVYMHCEKSAVNETELNLIKKYRPKYNIQGNDRFGMWYSGN